MADQGFRRVFLTVLDSVGVGELPDAEKYGDKGTNTLGNILQAVPQTRLPNLEALGLGNVGPFANLKPTGSPRALVGKMGEASNAKDTTAGHWELMGLVVETGFPLYPDGFPRELIEAFEREVGRKVIGNKPASGTEILKELGAAHVRTGALIVYTSGDSVFQIAAHEEVVSIPELYKACEVARRLCNGPWAVARIIARPFVGTDPDFERTPRRHDYSVSPFEPTVLDHLVAGGIPTYGIGKIIDIFNGCGVLHSTRTQDNLDGINKLIEHLRTVGDGSFVFANLVDFDMKYGHRSDAKGYAGALVEFDTHLPRILEAMKPTDLMIFTADHGCDPTDVSTDHSREYVPLIAYSPAFKRGGSLGVRKTFNDVGRTVEEIFGLSVLRRGQSFADEIVRACRP